MFPNQHIDTLENVDTESIRIMLFALPRSGSVWMFQVLGSVLGHGVARTHRYLEGSDDIDDLLLSVRDVRDAIVSHWRIHNSDVQSKRLMSKQEIYWNVEQYQHVFWAARRWLAGRPNAIASKYEDRIMHPEDSFIETLDAMRIKFDAHALRQALDEFSIDRNRQRIEDGSQDDPLLMKNHIREGSVGMWRQFVDSDGAELLISLVRDEMELFGYAGEIE